MKNAKLTNLITYGLWASVIGMVLYHFIYARYILQDPIGHINTHLGFSFLVLFLYELHNGKRKILSLIFMIISIIAVVYVQIDIEGLENRAMMNTRLDLVMGAILIISVLMGVYLSYGLVLPIVVSFFVLYMYFGHYIPPPLKSMPIPLDELIVKLSIGISGIYGQILEVSANYIFLFMIFSALIAATGAIDFFSQLGKLVSRFSKAGPALASVITSSCMASISGSAGANVMITGSFTIPAMKRIGYLPEQAGGIESAASTGGPIIPPIMGAAAFIMSAVTGIPYSKICLVSIIPALLYVLSCAAYVELQARRMRISPPREYVDVKILLNRLPVFGVPLVLMITLFLFGMTPMFVGFCACIAVFILSFFSRDTRLSPKKLIDALIQGASSGAQVGVTSALLGLVVKTIMACGLGIKLPILVGYLFGGNLFLMLIMTAIVAIILGCGLPAAAAYLLPVIVLAPSLIKMGVDLLPAHLFVFFYANFSFITPPVAISALFGAKLAEADYLKTAIEAAKVGIAGFILPFIIIFCPVVLFNFSNFHTSAFQLIAIILALVVLQGGVTGYWIKDLNLFQRIFAVMTSGIFMSYIFSKNLYLFFIGLLIGIAFTLWQRREKSLLEDRISEVQNINMGS
ncbi:MAG: TRAP transporter fused permease subunit [Deltaproteobacteria bacterium]|nr:TRAP transporter fused permease subunit [Deltaproteobacteria bacterium]